MTLEPKLITLQRGRKKLIAWEGRLESRKGLISLRDVVECCEEIKVQIGTNSAGWD